MKTRALGPPREENADLSFHVISVGGGVFEQLARLVMKYQESDLHLSVFYSSKQLICFLLTLQLNHQLHTPTT